MQHMVGANRSATVIAVNKDKNAPIFKQCDFGIVGDLNEILPADRGSVTGLKARPSRAGFFSMLRGRRASHQAAWIDTGFRPCDRSSGALRRRAPAPIIERSAAAVADQPRREHVRKDEWWLKLISTSSSWDLAARAAWRLTWPHPPASPSWSWSAATSPAPRT